MPTLLLNRQSRIIDPDSTTVTVICEARRHVSAGTCGRITPDPDRPYHVLRRDDLQGTPGDRDGRAVNVFADLPPGCYQAHSTLRSNCGQTVYMEIGAGGALTILGGRGAEDSVIARLNGMTPGELYDARRATRFVSDGLPPLEGSTKQVAWAEHLRGELIHATEQAGDLDPVHRIRAVHDATWFIAARDHPLDTLRDSLGG
jgi:hypothetical protein